MEAPEFHMGYKLETSLPYFCQPVLVRFKPSNDKVRKYIVAVCCLLFLEATMLVAIFFKMDWGKKISAYTGEENTYFEMVILINVKISSAITILILVAQSSVVILAAILLATGAEPRTHFLEVDTSIFIQSFLVPTESPGFAEISGQACRRCGTSLSLGGGTARRSFLSRIKSLLGRRFQRPNTVY
ncbi:hypothetical protein DKX38_010557 [Salix brachista]|uniref:Uncharacterized protein n=1 Tax=Salix brachista TaxID=2182728 RepID=A0A5N5MGJ2_9ROSI|nr:hypothetical protein DKX38_010557 [Salix brachista]